MRGMFSPRDGSRRARPLIPPSYLQDLNAVGFPFLYANFTQQMFWGVVCVFTPPSCVAARAYALELNKT